MGTKNQYMDKINDKIYLGDIDGANEIKYLQQEKITHVLSCCGIISPKYENNEFIQKVLDFYDFNNQNILIFIKEAIEFIHKADKVYVHCAAGISRSSSMVIAYLMWTTHKSYLETYKFVKEKRPCIDPNNGFVKQLKIFEGKLKENNYDLNKINLEEIKWP